MIVVGASLVYTGMLLVLTINSGSTIGSMHEHVSGVSGVFDDDVLYRTGPVRDDVGVRDTFSLVNMVGVESCHIHHMVGVESYHTVLRGFVP